MRILALLAAAIVPLCVLGNEPPTIHVTDPDRKIQVNPSVQHIPLNASQAHLRPPPAQIPKTFDIFVGLSVFRDGFRCGKTLFTGFKRAKHPERLYFGIVDQVAKEDERCIDEYCKMAKAEWPEDECRYKDHVRVDEHPADDSRGPTLARHWQQKLVRNEEFCLQLDAHSIFTNGWDDAIVTDWASINNEMAVMTTYIHNINDFVKENGDNNIPKNWLPHLCTTMRGGNGCVRTIGASMITGSYMPQMEALWGAGLSFSKCHSERRVLIDPHTLWMFDGEEFLRASHLWTHGYDLYSPSPVGSVIYHNYSKVPARFEFVQVDQEKKRLETEMGTNRFFLIVGKPFKGQVDAMEMDKYGFGTARTFKQYLEFSGVTFEEGKNDTISCKQLHWVPYVNATSVEQVVGHGWKLYSATKSSAPTPVEKARRPKDPRIEEAEKAEILENEGKGANDGAAVAHHEPVDGDATKVVMKEQLRQRAQTSDGMPTGMVNSLAVLVVVIIAVFFFAVSNLPIARRLRRQFRGKKKTTTTTT